MNKEVSSGVGTVQLACFHCPVSLRHVTAISSNVPMGCNPGAGSERHVDKAIRALKYDEHTERGKITVHVAVLLGGKRDESFSHNHKWATRFSRSTFIFNTASVLHGE